MSRTCVRTLELAELRCSEVWYAPDTRCPSRQTEMSSIEVILSGFGTQSLPSHDVHTHEGTVSYHPPGSQYSGLSGSQGVESIVVEIRPDAACRSILPASPLIRRGGHVVEAALKMRSELAANDLAARFAVQGLALEIVAEVGRAERAPGVSPAWFERAVELIESRCTEGIRGQEIASELGFNASYFARAFRQHARMTIAEYVRRLRIDLAIAELLTSNKPIVEIALACGFHDQPYFTRVFRAIVGMPPAEYRFRHTVRRGGNSSRPVQAQVCCTSVTMTTRQT